MAVGHSAQCPNASDQAQFTAKLKQIRVRQQQERGAGRGQLGVGFC